ncbi:hypothetical protein [Pasteurella testudinis]|uniref:hypothetical protein n=1 Tax=Pasteurella testudinis TaxID=761 RepID=UPI004058AC97
MRFWRALLSTRLNTAGPKIPEGDGYLAALINFRLIANDLWTTTETVKKLGVTI